MLELSEIQQIFFEFGTSLISVLRVSFECRCPIRESKMDTPIKRSLSRISCKLKIDFCYKKISLIFDNYSNILVIILLDILVDLKV